MLKIYLYFLYLKKDLKFKGIFSFCHFYDNITYLNSKTLMKKKIICTIYKQLLQNTASKSRDKKQL